MLGRKFNGRIVPGGADGQIIRAGTTDVQARDSIKTDSGGLILVTSDGRRQGPPNVPAALSRGDAVDPANYYFRTVMRFETANPAGGWLNRILAIARGQRAARHTA